MNPWWRGSSVVVPYVDYGQTLGGSRLAAIETGDFGKTWGTPVIVADVPRRFPGNAHFVASGTSLHAAFASGTAEARTVSVATSRDGLKWDAPVRVSSAGAPAFRPAIAVSSGGDIGTTWIEIEAGCTRLWFAASRDKGQTFSRAVPVAEDLSCGATAANRAAYERWDHGGDYFGLTADGDRFVAVWPDARAGTFQIYAATIAVSAIPIRAGPAARLPRQPGQLSIEQERATGDDRSHHSRRGQSHGDRHLPDGHEEHQAQRHEQGPVDRADDGHGHGQAGKVLQRHGHEEQDQGGDAFDDGQAAQGLEKRQTAAFLAFFAATSRWE